MASTTVKTITELDEVCEILQTKQRQRAVILKSRNMQHSRILLVIAGTIGYSTAASEKERGDKIKEAADLIDAVCAGKQNHVFAGIIRAAIQSVNTLNDLKEPVEKDMKVLAKRLPVYKWSQHEDQRGFGDLQLAQIVGECGSLSANPTPKYPGYANPAKLWRRMGCAPWEFNGDTKMGATWRSGREGKLPAEEWEKYGYSPRRRSIAYLIGEGLLKQNIKTDRDDVDDEGKKKVLWEGPYRKRYEEARRIFSQRHPDYRPKRCQLHGMLCATKMLLRELWNEWQRTVPKQ